MKKLNLKKLAAIAAAAAMTVSFAGCGGSSGSGEAAANGSSESAGEDTVKVGLLHSLTGSMAISEKSVSDAEKLAIDEINAAGGVLGKQIVYVEEDGASEPSTFATKII